MDRINIQASAQIFYKFSSYSTRTIQPNKKNERSTKVPIKRYIRNVETHLVLPKVVDVGTVYSDQTRSFSVTYIKERKVYIHLIII